MNVKDCIMNIATLRLGGVHGGCGGGRGRGGRCGGLRGGDWVGGDCWLDEAVWSSLTWPKVMNLKQQFIIVISFCCSGLVWMTGLIGRHGEVTLNQLQLITITTWRNFIDYSKKTTHNMCNLLQLNVTQGSVHLL